MELISKEPYEDEKNPHLSIRPLSTIRKNGLAAPASYSTIENYLKFVRSLYNNQCIAKGATSHVNKGLGPTKLAGIIKMFANS